MNKWYLAPRWLNEYMIHTEQAFSSLRHDFVCRSIAGRQVTKWVQGNVEAKGLRVLPKEVVEL